MVRAVGDPEPIRALGGATNSRLVSAAAERRLSDLAHDLGPMQHATEVADLYAGLARAVTKAIHADACSVSVVDETGEILRDVAASVVPPARLNSVAEEFKLDEFPATRAVIESGMPVEISVSDTSADKTERDYLVELGFPRVLICPLTVEGKNIGTIEAYRLADRGFRQDDPAQVAVIGSFAANSYSRIRLAERLESHYTETLQALAAALDAKDPYTQAHTGRITDLAHALGIALQLSPDTRRGVRLGAILHDVGKIGISDSILQKAGPLTESEWEMMRKHPVVGEQMLSGIEFVGPALPIIRHHHERWDGKGYPDGLAGPDIPIGARIVAVCDAFDAMTSDRPYRRAAPHERAFQELLDCAGSHFDPDFAVLFVEVMRQIGEEHLEEKFVRYAN